MNCFWSTLISLVPCCSFVLRSPGPRLRPTTTQQQQVGPSSSNILHPRWLRMRRSRQHATSSRDEGDGTSQSEQQQAKRQRVDDAGRRKRRRNQPGQNTYLKVLLNEITMSQLYGITCQLRDVFEKLKSSEQSSSPTGNQDSKALDDTTVQDDDDSLPTPTGEETEADPEPAKKSPLKIQPRSLHSLHLTLFFGGEAICQDMSAEELKEWYSAVQTRLALSNFFITASTSKEEESTNPTLAVQNQGPESSTTATSSLSTAIPCNSTDYWFRLSHFRTFPPRRNYLIVAQLEASPAWHALHDDLRSIASSSNSRALQEIVQYSKKDWTPHVTVANLRGGSRVDKQKLACLLSELPDDDSTENQQQQQARGIGLGGPIPSQIDGLDWDFEFHNSQSDR